MAVRQIKTVGVIVKPNHAEAWKTACELSDWLEKRGIALVGKPRVQSEASDGFQCDIDSVDDERFGVESDLIVVLGGDGTMISTARLVGDADVLVLGINYGSLGYLTDFRIEEMFPALESIFAGEFEIDRRVMLHAEHWRGEEMLAAGRVLNDVVINKAALARIIEIDVSLNGLFVNSFRGRADHFHSDRFDRVQPVGRRTNNISVDERRRAHADLSVYADQSSDRHPGRCGDRAQA